MNLEEKHLTPAELKKREEIAKAMEKDDPGIDMGKKMAIATAVAKRVAESEIIDEATGAHRPGAVMTLVNHPMSEQGKLGNHYTVAFQPDANSPRGRTKIKEISHHATQEEATAAKHAYAAKHAASGVHAMKGLGESNEVRTIKGKTYVSAAAALGKAKEIAHADTVTNPAGSKKTKTLAQHVQAAKNFIVGKKVQEQMEYKDLPILAFAEFNQVLESYRSQAADTLEAMTQMEPDDLMAIAESDNELAYLAQEALEITESVFNWKSNPSEIKWDDEKETERKDGKTVHKAREGSRNSEGGETEKKSVGRPKGEYGSYKIDPAKRADPAAKAALSAKVRAAKAEGFAARDEFKKGLDAALRKRQLEIAGLDK